MYCQRCGAQNPDGYTVCPNCGAQLASAPGPTVQGAQPSQWGAPAPSQAPQEGVVGAAWRDITSSPGWFKRVLALALIGCVPVMNFAVEGYCVRWGSELAHGRRSKLPDRVFVGKSVLTGFCAFLVQLGLAAAFGIVVFIAMSLIMGLFGIISPVASGAASVVLSIAFWVFELLFFGPVVDACVLHMGIADSLDEGFGFKTAWLAFRKNMGGLMAASIVPRLVVGLIGGLAVALIALIMTAVAGVGAMQAVSQLSSGMRGGSYGYGSYAGSYGSSMPLDALPISEITSMVFGLGTGIIVAIVVIALLVSVVNVLASLFAFRACGHWVARFAPEWANGSEAGESLAGEAFAVGAGRAGAQGFGTPTSVRPGQGVDVAGAPVAFGAVASDRTVTSTLSALGPKLTLVRVSSGRSYDLSAFPATVGKGTAADVRIEGTNSISRVHVRISYTGSAYIAEGLGATNGTRLNGVDLVEGEIAILHDGDELRLADESFIVRIA